jgi:hypothetical protein
VLQGAQITSSVGHPFKRKNRGPGDIGGEFFTQRSYVIGLNARSHGTWIGRYEGDGANSKATVVFDGFINPIPINSGSSNMFPSALFSSQAEMDAKGTTAISRCKPTNSVGDAATFLGELLKDGLPSMVGHTLWKDKTQRARDAGSEFLNVEFGWLPMVNDIRKLATAVSHASTVLGQYERDAGRQVRRNYTFPIETQVEKLNYPAGDGFPFIQPSSSVFRFSLGQGYPTVTSTIKKTSWFSGAFTYHLPSGYDNRNAMDRYALYARKVLGAEPTPELIWNLAPWSWAVDWFSNAGDVVSNLSDWAVDGLVMRYGYVMETITHEVAYTWTPTTTVRGKPVPTPVTFGTITKQRRQANPFGFGVTWDGLSPLQAAIAAALGLSRS